MHFFDTHCHLDALEFDPDRAEVVLRARQAGVGTLLVPGVSVAGIPSTLEVCARHPGCRPALGIHPLYVDQHTPSDLQVLREQLAQPGVVAVGEIGLDGFVPGLDRTAQEFWFAEQLRIARDLDLPVVLHVRHAVDDVLKWLRRIPVRGGIAHAFNGSIQQAATFIKLGFRLGFGGAMTFPRALRIRRLATELPMDALVLETDAPDIAPLQVAPGRNSPEYLPQIAQVLAVLRGISLAEVADLTTQNARQALRLQAP